MDIVSVAVSSPLSCHCYGGITSGFIGLFCFFQSGMKNNDSELPSCKIDIFGNSYAAFVHTIHGNFSNRKSVRTEGNWHGKTLTGDPSLQESPPSGSKHCKPIQKG